MNKKVFYKLILIKLALLSSTNLIALDEIAYKIKAGKTLHSGSIESLMYYKYSDGDNFHRHYDIGYSNSLRPSWSYRVSYRHVLKKNDDSWNSENRVYTQLEKTIKTAGLRWRFRTRQEFRFREDQDLSLRNRLRIQIKSRHSFLGIKPFIMNEIFYDFTDNQVSINWASVGMQFSTIKFKPEIYYKNSQKRNDDNSWDETHGLVIKSSFTF